MEVRIFDKIVKVPVYAILVALAGFVFLGAVLYGSFIKKDDDVKGELVSKDKVTQDSKVEKETNKISVYIVGCVKKEKVIEVEEGSTVADILKEVGGPTKNAALDHVNLAHKPVDSEMIKIPSKKEVKEGGVEANNGSDTALGSSDGKVNINSAGMDELITLTGIGEATAKKIIDYRESNGKFEKIEDIKNVSGIGEAKYASIKENICV